MILAAAVFFLISALIDFPFNNSPSDYSDIIDTFWNRTTPQQLHEVVVGILYVTYVFEYPPICGLILWLGGWASGGSVGVYATLEFGVLFVFTILTAHYMYLFMKYLGLSDNRQLVYSIFAPSLIFYGAYNYDIVQTFFVVAALYLFPCQIQLEMERDCSGTSDFNKTFSCIAVAASSGRNFLTTGRD